MPWSDDFNRADGPVGNGWNLPGGDAHISNNALECQAGVILNHPNVTQEGNQDLTITLKRGNAFAPRGGFLLKEQPSWDGVVSCFADAYNNQLKVTAKQYHNYQWWDIAAMYQVADPGGALTFRARYTDGVVTCYINGDVVLTGACPWAAPGTAWWIGGYENYAEIDYFGDSTPIPRTMAITPDPLWVGGGPCLVTATGNLTEWEGSTPPSTTFSADHGTVVSQNITSHTTALLIYEPDEYLGAITFSETQYSLSDTVNGVLTPPDEGTNGLCQLTPAGAEIINTAGGLYPGSQVLTNEQVIFPSTPEVPGALDFIGWASDIWHAHYGEWGGTSPTLSPIMIYIWSLLNAGQIPNTGAEAIKDGKSLKYDTELLKARWWNSLEEAYYGVDDILDAINAISQPDLSPIRADIGIQGQVLYVSLLEAVRAVRGDDVSSVLGILSELGIIRSGHAYTLESVMDAIAAIPAADIQAVLDRLDEIQPDQLEDLSTITDRIVDLHNDVGAVASSLAAYRTGSNYTVQSILDRLDDLEDKIDAIQTGGAPVWPGLANVTMGAPVALVDQLVLNGPMDGVVVAVTTPPVGLGQYRVGGRRLDYGQMRLAFETDNGELEGWQYFGFEEAVYTPHAMAQAAKCRFQLLGGLGGTVTPWVRS